LLREGNVASDEHASRKSLRQRSGLPPALNFIGESPWESFERNANPSGRDVLYTIGWKFCIIRPLVLYPSGTLTLWKSEKKMRVKTNNPISAFRIEEERVNFRSVAKD
jgi:hypothetical protein